MYPVFLEVLTLRITTLDKLGLKDFQVKFSQATINCFNASGFAPGNHKRIARSTAQEQATHNVEILQTIPRQLNSESAF